MITMSSTKIVDHHVFNEDLWPPQRRLVHTMVLIVLHFKEQDNIAVLHQVKLKAGKIESR